MPKIRIAIIESPNPIDLFDNRSEAKALEASCNLFGHPAISFFAKSRIEFQAIVKYLASSDSSHASANPSSPLFLHISSHGDTGCVAFGGDVVTWDELTKDLTPLLLSSDYSGKFALSLSTCGSGENALSTHVRKILATSSDIKMPSYIFSILGETVNWDDALIGWTLLYHKLSKTSITNRDFIIDTLKKIEACTGVRFAYRRWDENSKKYLRFPPANSN